MSDQGFIETVEKLHWDPQDILIVKTVNPVMNDFIAYVNKQLMDKDPHPGMIVYMRVHESIEKMSVAKANEILLRIAKVK